jgi:CRP/FNR family transcriptional regulator
MITTSTHSPADFSLIDCLARHPFFAMLTSSDQASIASQAAARAFRAGALIFVDSEPCAGLWVVETGGVKVFKINPEGDEHILHFLGRGDTFSEISALDGGPNPANAAAMTDAVCWLVPSAVVTTALRTYPEMALSVIGKLTTRVRVLVDHIESLALYPVAARLARFLLQQSDTPEGGAPHVTRAAISAHLATTPETISRLLRSFEEAGAIQFDRHRIIIVDPAALRAIAIL